MGPLGPSLRTTGVSVGPLPGPAHLGRNLRFARLSQEPRSDEVGTVLSIYPIRRTELELRRNCLELRPVPPARPTLVTFASLLYAPKTKSRSYRCGYSLVRRDDKIRTCDPLHPMQVRYRAALRPEKNSAGCKGRKKIAYFFSNALTFF